MRMPERANRQYAAWEAGSPSGTDLGPLGMMPNASRAYNLGESGRNIPVPIESGLRAVRSAQSRSLFQGVASGNR